MKKYNLTKRQYNYNLEFNCIVSNVLQAYHHLSKSLQLLYTHVETLGAAKS